MSGRLQFFFCTVMLAVIFPIRAQLPLPSPAAKKISVATNLLPPMPVAPSPVNFFRQLLVMSPLERNAALTNRPPETRARIIAKVREYLALAPDERELRLRATELRWYLTPLLHVAPADRATRLALVPEDLQPLVKVRLQQWDILPPPLQKEFLDNDRTLHYFARLEPTNQVAANPQQQKIAEVFDRFFELNRQEKQQTLNTLSAAERTAMEKTLRTFDQLPPPQRATCVHNYAKFAGMSAAERTEFLANAEHWSKLTPAERQSWRDLVAHVPILPPMPVSIFPPMPPKISRTSVATNLD